MVTRHREGHYILLKGSIQQDSVTIINIYIPNNRPSKGIKQKLSELEGKNSSIILVGEFNALLSIMYRKSRQNIRK